MSKFAAHLSKNKPPKPARRDAYRRNLARLILEHDKAARDAKSRNNQLPPLPPRRRIGAASRRVVVKRAPKTPETCSEIAAALLERKRTNGGYRPPEGAATEEQETLSEQAGRTLAAKIGAGR